VVDCIVSTGRPAVCVCGLQYLRLVRGFLYYGYVVFKPCTSDYPLPDTKVIVATGNKELNFRIPHKVYICAVYICV